MVTYPVQPWTNFIIVYIYVYVYEWKNLSESRPDCQLAGRTNNRQYMYMYIYIDVQMHYCECELCEDTCLYSSFNSLMENGMSISFSAVFVVVYALPVSLILTGSIDILGLCSSGSREAKSRLSMLLRFAEVASNSAMWLSCLHPTSDHLGPKERPDLQYRDH